MTEFELKFEVSPKNLKSVAAAMLQGKIIRQRLQASYFDTADGALAAHGIVLRLRKEGRRWVQTAKSSTADLLLRLEHNAALPAQRAGAVPAIDLARHRGTPIGKAIDKALGLKANDLFPKLKLLYGTDVQRVTRLEDSGTSMVEIALDQGRVFSAGRTQLICELEVELKEGSPCDAVALARQWCANHSLWMSTITKSMKGQRLGHKAALSDATSAVLAKFSRRAAGPEMVSAVVAGCLSQMLPNMSELAGGSQHPDHIHHLRVGIRRLRTALRELGGLTDAVDPAWEGALVRTFRALGIYRDHSQLVLVLQPQLLAAGGPSMLLEDANKNMVDPGKTVRAPEFQDTVLGLIGFVHRDMPKGVDKPDALKKAISLRLEKLYEHAVRDGKKFLALDEVQQHSVRKRLKRLRYLIEFSAPLFGSSKVNRMVAALKPVQDALGLYNDELMALQTWRALARDDPQAWFGIGWLTARKQPNAKHCLKEIKIFAKIKPFWRK